MGTNANMSAHDNSTGKCHFRFLRYRFDSSLITAQALAAPRLHAPFSCENGTGACHVRCLRFRLRYPTLKNSALFTDNSTDARRTTPSRSLHSRSLAPSSSALLRTPSPPPQRHPRGPASIFLRFPAAFLLRVRRTYARSLPPTPPVRCSLPSVPPHPPSLPPPPPPPRSPLRFLPRGCALLRIPRDSAVEFAEIKVRSDGHRTARLPAQSKPSGGQRGKRKGREKQAGH